MREALRGACDAEVALHAGRGRRASDGGARAMRRGALHTVAAWMRGRGSGRRSGRRHKGVDADTVILMV
jgi:hypothetical protein